MIDIETACYNKASLMVERGVVKLTEEMDIFRLTDLLIKLEREKEFKNNITDQLIDYNDEIIAIEEVGIVDTIDISVSGDNLFYCNNILTKNSFGLPATADFMFALISTEEMQKLNQLLVKQLKNRYNDLNSHKRFVIGIDRGKMKLYDLEQKAQDGVLSDESSASTQLLSPRSSKNKTDKFKNLKV